MEISPRESSSWCSWVRVGQKRQWGCVLKCRPVPSRPAPVAETFAQCPPCVCSPCWVGYCTCGTNTLPAPRLSCSLSPVRDAIIHPHGWCARFAVSARGGTRPGKHSTRVCCRCRTARTKLSRDGRLRTLSRPTGVQCKLQGRTLEARAWRNCVLVTNYTGARARRSASSR